MSLTYETRRLDDGRVLVEMKGKINERFDSQSLLTELRGKRPVLELSSVRHISSVGIREFESFLAQLGDVTMIDVSPAVASHLVLMPTLSARVKVESARLPFTCEACGAEATATIPFRFGAATANAPACACGKRMFLDGMAEQLLPSPA